MAKTAAEYQQTVVAELQNKLINDLTATVAHNLATIDQLKEKIEALEIEAD